METKAPSNLASSQNPKSSITKSVSNNRDFLNHLEAYLAKRDGVDKLLKISRYATRIILASSLLPETLTLNRRLKSFESSVGVSRKAFRLGKFVQDLNALRNTCFDSKEDVILSIIAYGGEGLYMFIEQFVWFVKSGLIDAKHSRNLQKISAWAEFVGYIGSISLKIRDLKRINEDESRLLNKIIHKQWFKYNFVCQYVCDSHWYTLIYLCYKWRVLGFFMGNSCSHSIHSSNYINVNLSEF
ncbi:unnamed protein product, partial [Vitis vinifera]